MPAFARTRKDSKREESAYWVCAKDGSRWKMCSSAWSSKPVSAARSARRSRNHLYMAVHANLVGHPGQKPWFFGSLNDTAEAATHNNHFRESFKRSKS